MKLGIMIEPTNWKNGLTFGEATRPRYGFRINFAASYRLFLGYCPG